MEKPARLRPVRSSVSITVGRARALGTAWRLEYRSSALPETLLDAFPGRASQIFDFISDFAGAGLQGTGIKALAMHLLGRGVKCSLCSFFCPFRLFGCECLGAFLHLITGFAEIFTLQV